MSSRILIFYIIFLNISNGKSSETNETNILNLIERIFFTEKLKTITFVIMDKEPTFLYNIELPHEVLRLEQLSLRYPTNYKIIENQQNKLLVIVPDPQQLCAMPSEMKRFDRILVLFMNHQEIYPKKYNGQMELTDIFHKTCLSLHLSGCLFYREKDFKLYRLPKLKKGPSHLKIFTEIDIFQKSYFPLINDLENESTIEVWVKEFIFPIFFTYNDKVSNSTLQFGGFQYHLIKTFTDYINGKLVVRLPNFTSYYLKDNTIENKTFYQVAIGHRFFIGKQTEIPRFFFEYFSNEMVYPMSTVRGTKYIYGKVFEYSTWIGVLSYIISFVILCCFLEKNNIMRFILDGIKYSINQNVRIPRKTVYIYKSFLLGSFILNTIHSNLCGGYSKILYYEGLKDDRIKVLKNSDFKDSIYSQDLQQNYLTRNAYILEPFQYEAFKAIQILRRNSNFLHEQVNNSKKMFLSMYHNGSIIQEEVKLYLLYAYSSGLMHKWKQDVALEYFRGNLKNFEIENLNTEASFNPETMENLLIAFTIIIGGLTISSIVFYIEILTKTQISLIINNFVFLAFFICLVASNGFSIILNLYD